MTAGCRDYYKRVTEGPIGRGWQELAHVQDTRCTCAVHMWDPEGSCIV
jgi:hypothetical protein